MLRDRTYMSQKKLYVAKDVADSGRSLYYRIFTLADDIEEEQMLKPLPYWDPNDEKHTRLSLPDDQYVLLTEMENGLTVERYAFYNAVSPGKLSLTFTVSKNLRYGRNAYLISIRWNGDEDPEPVNTRYVILKNGKGERLYFLREHLEPLDPYGGKRVDEYVLELPDGARLSDYTIDVHPLVKERYRVSIDM